jgi:hypothetical protein
MQHAKQNIYSSTGAKFITVNNVNSDVEVDLILFPKKKRKKNLP